MGVCKGHQTLWLQEDFQAEAELQVPRLNMVDIRHLHCSWVRGSSHTLFGHSFGQSALTFPLLPVLQVLLPVQ